MGGKSRKSGQISKALIDRIKAGGKKCGSKPKKESLGVELKKETPPEEKE